MIKAAQPKNRQYDDIETLVNRIKFMARNLKAEDMAAEPPPNVYRNFLNNQLDSPFDSSTSPETYIVDEKNPKLSEIFCANYSDEFFLTTAYKVLLGRAPDKEGETNYLAQLPKAGRLYIVADLLCAEEAQASLGHRGVQLKWQFYLTYPLYIANKLGPLKRLARFCLRPAYRVASVAMRPHFRKIASLDYLQHYCQRQDALIRDVLLDMDIELQRLHTGLYSQGRNIEYLQKILKDFENKSDESSLDAHLSDVSGESKKNFYNDNMTIPEQSASQNFESAVNLLPQSEFDAYYLAFEDACRGSKEEIQNHLKNYQPVLESISKIGYRAIDLGCGRGEWLALLQSNGFTPHGIDLNTVMVEHCRERGFQVTCSDAIVALRQQPDNSHALVSGFHIAEHLPFEVLYTLVNEAQRILKPGGMLLLETPNPENILVGSHTFYHDPTHRNPLTPTSLTFLFEYHGLVDVTVQRYNPYSEEAKVPGNDQLTERVNGHLCGPQDFAVLGRKRVSKASPLAAHGLSNSQQEGM